jgi:tRNA dimethylallyltransferase
MNKPKIIVISGATSTGKSNLAVKLAKQFNGEIISADSRYVYKEIDIATAKPSETEKEGIPHYLIDICNLDEEYSVGLFVKDADYYIKEITNRKKIPIIAGGTGLYFRSLCGTFDIPEVPADKLFRQKAENLSSDVLYNELLEKNAAMAQKIHKNNKVKIIRALEITNANVQLKGKECPYDILWINLEAKDRDFLYKKADNRVDIMFQNGLLNEAISLFKKYKNNKILLNTIGVKEFLPLIQGVADIENVKEEIKKNTRHYIKRQISWFKGEKDTKSLFIDTENIIDLAFKMAENFVE